MSVVGLERLNIDNAFMYLSVKDFSVLKQDWLQLDVKEDGYSDLFLMRLLGDMLICVSVVIRDGKHFVYEDDICKVYDFCDLLDSIPDSSLYLSNGDINFPAVYDYIVNDYTFRANVRELDIDVLQYLLSGGSL